MSVASSENNYKIAKSLYQDISDDFYEIENNDGEDSYMIDQTLEDIKRLNRHINRIHIEELEDNYDTGVIEVLQNNIDTFKEASYYIERALMSMKLFDKIHPVLDKYMKGVMWKNIADTQEEAVMKFGRFLTSEKNYENYRTFISNIVKGTMNKRAFTKLYNSISNRLAKPKPKKKVKQRSPLPPEMWPEKEQKAWKERGKKRFESLGRRFISFNKYKKLTD